MRVTQLVFGPYSPYPVAWRVMGPDPHALLDIAERVKSVLQASPLDAHRQYRLGFAGTGDAFQPQSGPAAGERTQLPVRCPAAAVPAVRDPDHHRPGRYSRRAGDRPRGGRHPSGSGENRRLPPLVGSGGQRVPLSQIGDVSIRMEDPLLRRRDRTPTITVRGDVAENLQSPDVSTALMKPLQPIIDSLPPGYRIETAGSIEESGKATRAMMPLFPIMIASRC